MQQIYVKRMSPSVQCCTLLCICTKLDSKKCIFFFLSECLFIPIVWDNKKYVLRMLLIKSTIALGDFLTYTVKQKSHSAVWMVHPAWGQNWKDFLQLLFYCMQSKQLLILAKPITSAEFLFCPTTVGKAHGYLKWAHSKYNKMWVESCSDCKENVCVWGGKVVCLFLTNHFSIIGTV